MPRRTLRSKFVFTASAGVLAGLGLSTAVAVIGAGRLRERSSVEVERGLAETSQAHLVTQGDVLRGEIDRLLAPARQMLGAMADIGQTAIDQKVEIVGAKGPRLLEVDAVGRKRETGKGESMSIGIWADLRDAKGETRPEVLGEITRTAPLELAMPAIRKNGTSILQAYQVGPRELSYMRMSPDYPLVPTMERLYPGSTRGSFWTFFFPGLVETWEESVGSPGFEVHAKDTVFTKPYEDAGGGGVVVSMFRPLWSSDRRALLGAVAIDVALADIIRTIQAVHASKSGFAFLVDSDGEVLAINDPSATVLGLKTTGLADDAQGVKLVSRKLTESTFPTVTALASQLPSDDAPHARAMTINGRHYSVVLRRYASLDTWTGEKGFRKHDWTVGLVAPNDELFATLTDATRVIGETSTSVLVAQGGITLATLVAVVLGLMFVARRMTAPLTALTAAARTLEERRYEVDVPDADDEIGELTTAFRGMAQKVRANTEQLERRVAERTEELNRTLADLWSEMDLAQKIQTVLLPEDGQLGGYDLAARMIPASAVGGDYYDFLPHGRYTWVLIGDVSGHGVTAGLIMMMAQTAARTAILGSPEDAPPSPSAVLAVVNRAIRANLERIGRGQYMTITALRLGEDGEVVHAGLHQDLVIARASGAREQLETSGLWLGLVDDVAPHLSDERFRLERGDALLLHTDGVTEAKRADDVVRGDTQALAEAFAATATKAPPKDVIEDIFRRLAIESFDDDATVIVVRRPAE